ARNQKSQIFPGSWPGAAVAGGPGQPSAVGSGNFILTYNGLHSLFEQQRSNLHRACVRLRGDFLKLLECLRREPDQALLAPRRISGASAAIRNAETRCDLGSYLKSAEVTTASRNLSTPFRPQ